MQYTVGEMAKRLHVAPSTLRYYDKEGLLPFLERSSGGIRIFQDSDFEWLSIISCLKQTGMPIKDIKAFIDWCIEATPPFPNVWGSSISSASVCWSRLSSSRQPSTFWITSTGITKPLKSRYLRHSRNSDRSRHPPSASRRLPLHQRGCRLTPM